MNHVTTPVQQLWDILSNKFMEMMDKHIPTKMTSRHNQIWINGTIKKLSRQKYRAFNRAIHTESERESERDWRYYRKLKKAARFECKRAYRTYLNDICNEDQNNKKFWAFIKSRRCDRSGVAPLRRNGTTSNDSKAQANILNDQFVFTNENTENMPTKSHHCINVSEAGVKYLLRSSKSTKHTRYGR